MATVILPAREQRVVLDNVSWAMYEDLLDARRDRSVPRFTYDEGQLEIMSPSTEHEELKDVVALLVNAVAEELNINTRSFGSATFRREDVKRGFEPDGCFYIQSLARIKGKTNLDLRTDPPPDLVVEIDITDPSLPKFPIFARLAVPEVWLYDGERMRIYGLADDAYVERTISLALPGVTAEAVSRFIDESFTFDRIVWLRRVREWARQI